MLLHKKKHKRNEMITKNRLNNQNKAGGIQPHDGCNYYYHIYQ
jgi:hypothetical protein